jgi:hypothetical protein
MRYSLRASVAVLTASVTLVFGRLVQTPFLTQPPVQRMTRSVALDEWGIDFFEQCHGVAGAGLTRLEVNGVTPYVLAFSDPPRNRLTFGLVRLSDSVSSYEWFDDYGFAEPGFQSLRGPEGVCLDTVQHGGDPNSVYLYVANRYTAQVTAYRVNLQNRQLTFVDSALTQSRGELADVAVIPSGDGGSRLMALNDWLGQVTVVGVGAGPSFTRLDSFGSRGPGTGQFLNPSGVCTTPVPGDSERSFVYVADRGNRRIVRLAMDNATGHLTWDRSCSVPDADLLDIAANPSGCVYAVDGARGRILVFDGGLSTRLYAYGEENLLAPRELAIIGDRVGLCEEWGDTSGIQYLRVVPDVVDLEGGGLFDATSESVGLGFKLQELDAVVAVDVRQAGQVVRHLVQDTLLAVGGTHSFFWNGSADEGHLGISGTQYLIP